MATRHLGVPPTRDDDLGTVEFTQDVAGSRDFGFCQSELGNPDWFTTQEIRDTLQGIKDIGASHVRLAAWWVNIEPTLNGGYVWTGMDRAMNLCEEYGVTPLVCITSPAPAGTPTITDYAELCGAIAARYGASGTQQLSQYEIYNEINHRSYYAPFESNFGVAHYTDLLIAAAAAIRAVDSRAFILTAGFMSTADFAPNDILPSTFLQGIYNEGGGDAFDGVAYHWYSGLPDFSGMEEPTRDQYFYEDLLACRAIMVAEEDDEKDVYITEMGFPITLDPDVRADWTAKQIELLADLPWVRRSYIYNFRPGNETESGADAQYGIVDWDFTPKLPLYDYVASINAVVPAAFSGTGGGSTVDAEYIRDTIGAALVAGSGVSIAASDAGDTITITATGGGGSGTPPYVGVLGAVIADTPFNVTHSLNSNNIEVAIHRSWLMSGGVTTLNRGEELGPFKWWRVDPNTIRIDLSINATASELIVKVKDMGAAGDTTNPVVGTLSSPTQTTTTIDLSLSGSSDNVAVVGREWERSVSSIWTPIATTAASTYQDTGLPMGLAQSYRARVFDLQGRFSAYSNTITPSTLPSLAVALNTVGAGNRVTGTTTISASQVVAAGSGNHIVVYLMMTYGNWFGSTDSEWNPMTLTSNQGVASAPGTPVALTRRESQVINAGNPTAVIHLYELDNPATATHTLTLGSVPGGIGSVGHIMIFSASYRNVAALDNVTSGLVNTATGLNQNVVAGTDSMAIMGAHFNPVAPITGFSKTLRDSDGGSPATAGVFGDAPGEADNSVNFTTTTAEWHAYIGARLLKL